MAWNSYNYFLRYRARSQIVANKSTPAAGTASLRYAVMTTAGEAVDEQYAAVTTPDPDELGLQYSIVTQAGQSIVDDFESYSPGNLVGQDPWVSAASVPSPVVQESVSFSPAKSIEMTGAGNLSRLAARPIGPSGDMTFRVRAHLESSPSANWGYGHLYFGDVPIGQDYPFSVYFGNLGSPNGYSFLSHFSDSPNVGELGPMESDRWYKLRIAWGGGSFTVQIDGGDAFSGSYSGDVAWLGVEYWSDNGDDVVYLDDFFGSLEAKYVVATSHDGTDSARYAVKASIGGTLADKYGVKTTPAPGTRSAKYAVKTSADPTLAARYEIKTTPGAGTLSARYEVDAPEDATLQAQYAVKTTPGAGSLGVAYRIRTSSQAGLSARYEIDSESDTTLPAKYAVLVVVPGTLGSGYGILHVHAAELDATYEIDTLEDTALPAKYAVRTTTGTGLPMEYRIRRWPYKKRATGSPYSGKSTPYKPLPINVL